MIISMILPISSLMPARMANSPTPTSSTNVVVTGLVCVLLVAIYHTTMFDGVFVAFELVLVVVPDPNISDLKPEILTTMLSAINISPSHRISD